VLPGEEMKSKIDMENESKVACLVRMLFPVKEQIFKTIPKRA